MMKSALEKNGAERGVEAVAIFKQIIQEASGKMTHLIKRPVQVKEQAICLYGKTIPDRKDSPCNIPEAGEYLCAGRTKGPVWLEQIK